MLGRVDLVVEAVGAGQGTQPRVDALGIVAGVEPAGAPELLEGFFDDCGCLQTGEPVELGPAPQVADEPPRWSAPALAASLGFCLPVIEELAIALGSEEHEADEVEVQPFGLVVKDQPDFAGLTGLWWAG